MRELTSADGAASTFETFVVSESSRGAFDLAIAVADDRTDGGNPLLIHGPIGSGKTHLLQAIAHRIRSQRPGEAIVSAPAQTVIAQLTDAIRMDEVRAFRATLAALDVLLLDDFPPLRPDRQLMREEIVRTLEELVTNGVQVVVASIAPLATIRPESVVVGLGYPDRSARAEITRRSAESRGLVLSESVIDCVAEHCGGSPREIQSAVARIAAETAIALEPLDRARVAQIVSRG